MGRGERGPWAQLLGHPRPLRHGHLVLTGERAAVMRAGRRSRAPDGVTPCPDLPAVTPRAVFGSVRELLR
ncbi:hypothetical protein ACIBVL_21425 [Streptomyces sp. NPDC049687]|uniref:hypothetical protein n=1 Tax=Streptomyces sp. NPDC049687 TaxID=3365596 RepID=UPI0037A89A2D